jgi:hypothetical protein
MLGRRAGLAIAGLVCGCALVFAQAGSSDPLMDVGKVTIAGREVSYHVRNLPVSSFPDLPGPIAAALIGRGCVIPQTYEARRPENVVRGSFENAGSSDWAVLCSKQGRVALLVFFGSRPPAEPIVLKESLVTERLQANDSKGEFGFNWGIDPASPQKAHTAQAGIRPRPQMPDHDSLADSVIDHKTVFHLYRNSVWEKVEVDDSF